MDSSCQAYKKLPIKRRNTIGYDRLWLGLDHLLVVESTRVSERYHRFFFRDIQAVTLLKTKSGLIRTIVLGIVFLLTVAVAAGNWENPMGILAAIIGAVIAYYLVLSLIKGASCDCWIYTSVQKQKIRPVASVRAAKKLMDILVPKIVEAQGRIPYKAAPAGQSAAEKGPGSMKKPSPLVSARRASPSSAKPISLYWHWILFSLLLVKAGQVAASLFYRSPWMTFFSFLLVAATILAGVIAVCRQVGAGIILESWLKGATLASLVQMLLILPSGYAKLIFLMIERPEEWAVSSHNQWELVKLMNSINPMDHQLLLGINCFFIAGCFSLGVMGLVFLCFKGRR